MPAPLAIPTYIAGAQNDVAAVDVYTQTTADAPIDSSGASPNDPSGVSSFLGQTDVSSDINSTLTSVSSPSLTPATVVSGFISPDSNLQSSFAGLDDDVKAQLTATDATMDVAIADTTSLATLPSVSTLSSAKNITGISGMLDVVANIGKGGLKVTDINSSITVLSNLVKVSAQLNIPNAYARIDAGGYASSIMGPVTQAALKVAVSTSNVNLLTNVANGSLSSSVNAMFPGLAASFSANFKLASGTSANTHAQIGLDISSAFGKINANWASTPISGSRTSLNANLFLNASADFQTVMQASATFSRTPLKTTTTTTLNVAANLVPVVTALPPGTRHATLSLNASMQFIAPSGLTQTYSPNSDGTFNQTTSLPQVLTTDSTTINALDTSPVNDPMALGYGFSQCLRTASMDTNSTTPNPTLGAASSLMQNFPLTTFGTLDDFAL